MESESRMLKAVCKKTGRYFGLELKKIGATWKVVNMVVLSDEERKIISSEVRQMVFETNDNLIACSKCGNRKIGSCSCARKKHQCSARMKYEFDCVYCDALEIDYSRSLGRGPYTKWAGTSNIPDAIKDRYGNPQGSQYDLAQDGSFEGYKIIVLNLCGECDFSNPRIALQKKGFAVLEYKSMPSARELISALKDDRSQLWIISHRESYMSAEHIRIISDYYNSHHGVYIWGDNNPYYADANKLLNAIFSTQMSGDYIGDHVLGIQQTSRAPGIISNHPITTGIVSFYEGKTIANIDIKQVLQPLIYASDGKVVTAYYDSNGKRALVDGGFTRLYYKWNSAGTDRYIVNAAAWLANIEHFGYFN